MDENEEKELKEAFDSLMDKIKIMQKAIIDTAGGVPGDVCAILEAMADNIAQAPLVMQKATAHKMIKMSAHLSLLRAYQCGRGDLKEKELLIG